MWFSVKIKWGVSSLFFKSNQKILFIPIFLRSQWTVMNWLSVVRLLTAPGAEHTVGAPVSCSEGNAGPVWWDVEPTVLHLFPLMGSASPLQVCISLIKKCLCASCLPSARFIIKVSWWENKRFGGNSGWPSRFTNLWSSFHEHGGPRCSSCRTHGYLFAKGAYMVKPTWLAAPCPCAPPL